MIIPVCTTVTFIRNTDKVKNFLKPVTVSQESMVPKLRKEEYLTNMFAYVPVFREKVK